MNVITDKAVRLSSKRVEAWARERPAVGQPFDASSILMHASRRRWHVAAEGMILVQPNKPHIHTVQDHADATGS
jgi:hypothetical protein